MHLDTLKVVTNRPHNKFGVYKEREDGQTFSIKNHICPWLTRIDTTMLSQDNVALAEGSKHQGGIQGSAQCNATVKALHSSLLESDAKGRERMILMISQ